MKNHPKLLVVETGYQQESHKYFPTTEVINYRIYDNVPRFWRRMEEIFRMDFYLAFKVKSVAHKYDIVWATSEKVGVPLSFLSIKKPLVVILQHPESPLRVALMKLTGIAKRWDGIGIVAKGTRDFLQTKFGVDPKKVFQYYSARTDVFNLVEDQHKTSGTILSMGVAKRDYDTLIEALSELPGYQTEIFISSKYGDKYAGGNAKKIVDWIKFPEKISYDELLCRYQQARFVIVPLQPTSHTGAGVTSVFEASACGKAVIATRTGGMESYVVHGETGLLVPPRDVSALQNAIKTLWGNGDLARRMGEAGRKFVEENYGFQRVNSGIISFLMELWKVQSQVEQQMHK